jgi:hypothetical protein
VDLHAPRAHFGGDRRMAASVYVVGDIPAAALPPGPSAPAVVQMVAFHRDRSAC